MVNNLNDGLAWGLFPLYFAAAGLSVAQIGILSFTYPAVWGLLQLWTGALSDRWGRKRLIAGGMLVQGGALAAIAVVRGFWPWVGAAAVLGTGTAMVYPTLLAAVGDVAHPRWRASAVGVYRLWRDSGYAAGAIVGGVTADLCRSGPWPCSPSSRACSWSCGCPRRSALKTAPPTVGFCRDRCPTVNIALAGRYSLGVGCLSIGRGHTPRI
jgi:MFS family permease